ncbi:MAG: tRNA (adenosine(37)-N6)-dimethylallyltransferase MiaA [Synechococcales bacterium]|nr:tRNA (adenosine(37)-N6)-dimethylallyltransferase MiaA [Synechococcales bacterium]
MHVPFAPALIVIGGPTATGKSSLALALAQRLQTVIISADSRQVYRRFDIGTAKPSMGDRQQVPHYLIDCCDPTETLTLADYQSQAQAIIHQMHTHSSKDDLPPGAAVPLLVGGTGLYIKSVVRGLRIPRVPPQKELRSQLAQLGQTQCHAMLRQVDPVAAAKIHQRDQVRTLRALEVFYTTGCPLSDQQGEFPPSYPILEIGLDCANPDALTPRIRQRTEAMIAAGFVEEVKALVADYGADLPLLATLGYQEVKEYLVGDRSLPEAIDLTVLHTRQFAKRQRTWFRANPAIHWFDADHPQLLEQVWELIQNFLSERAAGGGGTVANGANLG